jgi:hypothetical protein
MDGCKHCGGSLAGKRPHAQYCTRTCKNAASQKRRTAEGRVDNAARYAKERDRRLEYARKYHKTHPEQSKAVRARRRARKRNAKHFEFTERDWSRLVARFRGCCAYCGQPSNDLQKEHVIPLSRGGTHGAGNILPSCPSCNYRKHTSLLAEFRYKRGGYHALRR